MSDETKILQKTNFAKDRLKCNDKSVTIIKTGGVVLWKRQQH